MLKSEFSALAFELFKNIESAYACIGISEILQKIENLKQKTLVSNFWDDPKNAGKISQELSFLEKKRELWDGIFSDGKGIVEMIDFIDGDNSKEQDMLEKEYFLLLKKFSDANIELLLSGPFDTRNALLEITAGAGGTEAQDFAEMLLRMYLRFCERKGWKAEIIEQSDGVEAGIKSVMLEISGIYAFGFLQAEKGTHRLVRLSPFNAKSLRQTSFAGVMIMPDLEESDTVGINIPDSEIRVDTFRASGAGGQHVNKTDSAVRMVHLPTGIVVTCQNQRSQHQNRDKAMQILKSRLAQLRQEEEQKKLSEMRGEHTEAAWGTQIRNYVLHPYKLVKDTRTGYETQNPELILDGDLDDFQKAYLEWKAKSS